LRWGGFDPLPEKAIVAPEHYKGLNMRSRPHGTKTPCSKDDLREFVRIALQMNPKQLWFDTDFPEYTVSRGIDQRRPNPYGPSADNWAPQGGRVPTKRATEQAIKLKDGTEL